MICHLCGEAIEHLALTIQRNDGNWAPWESNWCEEDAEPPYWMVAVEGRECLATLVVTCPSCYLPWPEFALLRDPDPIDTDEVLDLFYYRVYRSEAELMEALL